MITTSDFSKGQRLLIDGDPYTIVDVTVQSPSARGGATLVKFKARNLLTGRLSAQSVKSGSKFEEPDLQIQSVQYLFTQGSDAVFMDLTSYEQFNLSLESLGNAGKYLTEELKLKAMYFNGNPVNIDFPQSVPLKIDSVEPGTRGNTASSSVTTKAILSNGVECQVPLNIKEGDVIMVNTDDDSYHQRS